MGFFRFAPNRSLGGPSQHHTKRERLDGRWGGGNMDVPIAETSFRGVFMRFAEAVKMDAVMSPEEGVMTMKGFSEGFILECKMKLIESKREILNRVRTARVEFAALDRTGGDDADQTMNLLAENDFLSAQTRLKEQLLEIELALARIESGRFGICEETEEPIELERLRALPWTRLSIEGAEIREVVHRKFAR